MPKLSNVKFVIRHCLKAPMLMPKPSNVLSGLPKRLLSELFEDAVVHKLRDGEVLFRAGDVGDGCYQIQTGLIKVVVTSERGEERIISLLGPDAIVGELSMIDGGPRSASVIAIADCSLSFLSRAKFQTCIDSRPELTSYLVKTLARRLREADDSLAATTFLSVKGRLARALLNVAEYVGEGKGGGRIQLRLKISRGDLAAMAGVAQENVSRTMSEWRKRDVVTRSSNYYCINNPTALARDMKSEIGGERKSSAFSPDHASTVIRPRPPT